MGRSRRRIRSASLRESKSPARQRPARHRNENGIIPAPSDLAELERSALGIRARDLARKLFTTKESLNRFRASVRPIAKDVFDLRLKMQEQDKRKIAQYKREVFEDHSAAGFLARYENGWPLMILTFRIWDYQYKRFQIGVSFKRAYTPSVPDTHRTSPSPKPEKTPPSHLLCQFLKSLKPTLESDLRTLSEAGIDNAAFQVMTSKWTDTTRTDFLHRALKDKLNPFRLEVLVLGMNEHAKSCH